MLRRSQFVLAVSLAALVASWGCATNPPLDDPQRQDVGKGATQAVHSQLEQQLAALTTELAAEFGARQVNRVCCSPSVRPRSSNAHSWIKWRMRWRGATTGGLMKVRSRMPGAF